MPNRGHLAKGGIPMSEENKAIMRRIYDEAISSGDWDLLRQLCAEDLVSGDAPPGRPQGLEAEIQRKNR